MSIELISIFFYYFSKNSEALSELGKGSYSFIPVSYYFFSGAFFLVIKSKIDATFSGNYAIFLHKDYNNTNFKIFHQKGFSKNSTCTLLQIKEEKNEIKRQIKINFLGRLKIVN